MDGTRPAPGSKRLIRVFRSKVAQAGEVGEYEAPHFLIGDFMEQEAFDRIHRVLKQTEAVIKIVEEAPVEHRLTVVLAVILSLGEDGAATVFERIPDAILQYRKLCEQKKKQADQQAMNH